MASFTGVGDNVELSLTLKGERFDVAISGTYNMTIDVQREEGSKGSGAWRTFKSYTTADATVADTFSTDERNETVRLVVQVDTSGTATATITNPVDETVGRIWKDPLGATLLSHDQDGAVFPGSVRVRAVYANSTPVDVTAATVTITAKEHAGRVVTLSRAAGITATLPAATGSGNVYKFFVGTTVTSNNDIIEVANSTDVIQGVLGIVTDIAGVVLNTAATTDTITMNGTTTGGVIGSWVEVQDVASGFFSLTGSLISTGTEATPFSAAV